MGVATVSWWFPTMRTESSCSHTMTIMVCAAVDHLLTSVTFLQTLMMSFFDEA